jgi:hypothetical protein
MSKELVSHLVSPSGFQGSRVSDTDLPPSADTPVSTPLSGGADAHAQLLTGPSWQEQDGILRDLWMQNKTPQEISAVLGRSVAAIMTRAARLGMPRRSAPGRKPGSRRILQEGQDQNTQSRAAMPRTTNRVAREGEEPPPQVSARICLMCLRSFQSQGRHNRICSNCKGTSEYGAAVALADIHFPV